jgi:hypothetical protein
MKMTWIGNWRYIIITKTEFEEYKINHKNKFKTKKQ